MLSERAVMDPELMVHAQDLVAAYITTAGDEIYRQLRRDEMARRSLIEESQAEVLSLDIMSLFQR